jgi:site-specific recombinase XerC
LKDFLARYSAEARPPLSRAIIQQYRSVLESAGLAPPSINLRLSAIRKLVTEAAENDLLDRSVAQGIVSLKGVRHPATGQGTGSAGNRRATCSLSLRSRPSKENGTARFWRFFSAAPCSGASSRALDCAHIQQRGGRWVFVALVGKGNRIRTVPIPPFLKVAIDAWTAAAG